MRVNSNGKSTESYTNKSMFKDKKLNFLWEKAEVAGFTADELKYLKNEFNHHQDKVDVYYSLLNGIEVRGGIQDKESKFFLSYYLKKSALKMIKSQSK